jgi:predicted peptidase
VLKRQASDTGWARRAILTPLLPALLAVGCHRSARAVERPYVPAKVSLHGLSLPYAVYLPPGYTPTKRWPVILFLHGFGARGEDGAAQTRDGVGPVLRQHPERFPCLVVMPQAPRSRVRWSGDVNDLALKALDTAVRQYHGDPRRLYLTGCSMGGAGSWRIATAHPRRFAALLVVCGRGKPQEMAPALKSVPIWVFHGAEDHLVPVQTSRAMVQAIRAAGGTKIRYTEYPGVGHDAWDRAYADPQVIAWLLAQKR